MWLMMLGCCFAIPLALIIGGVTAGGLAGAQPWLLAIAGALAIAFVIAHRATSGPRCETPETDVGRGR
jgi:cytosine/uracil/thiamine/allantoin permease